MKSDTKFGEIEYSLRHDGKYAVYKYMPDPTLTQEEAENCRRIDYTPGKWVQIDVLKSKPKGA